MRSLQQRKGVLHILRPAQEAAHPAGLRQQVVRLGQPLGDDLIPDATREGNVNKGVAVDVTQLASAKAVLGTAEAVWGGRHTVEAFHGFPNPGGGSCVAHGPSLSLWNRPGAPG